MLTIDIEKLKSELIENYCEEDVVEFIEVFGEKMLTHYEEIKHKALKCNVELEVLKDFINNFSIYDLDLFSDSFQGVHDSFVSFAEELFNDCYLHQIPINLRGYIDYEAFANDLKHDYSYSDSGHIFCNSW